MPAGTGYSSGSTTHLYQGALASLSLDPDVNDGNTATGPDQGPTSPPAQMTVIIDMGADVAIRSIGLATGWIWNLTRILEYATSAAPTTWITIATSPAVGHAGTFSVVSETVSGLALLARYIRYSVADDGNTGLTSGRVSVREVDVNVGTDYTQSWAPGYQQAPTEDAKRYLALGGGGISQAGSGSAAVSLVLDYGYAVTINQFAAIVGFANSVGTVWEQSPDGITWSALATTASNTPPAGTGEYQTFGQIWTPTGGGGSVTNQFFRLSAQDTGSIAQIGIEGVSGSPSVTSGGTGGGGPVLVGSIGVSTGGFVGIDFDHTDVFRDIAQFNVGDPDMSSVVEVSYNIGVQFVSGKRFNDDINPNGFKLYYFKGRFGEWFYNSQQAYFGYHMAFDSYWTDGMDPFFGWFSGTIKHIPPPRLDTPIGNVYSDAIGNVYRLVCTKATRTYANKRTISGSVYYDRTLTTEYWYGNVTLTAFTLPVIPAHGTTTVAAQGFGEGGISPDYQRDPTQLEAVNPYGHDPWWDISNAGDRSSIFGTDTTPKAFSSWNETFGVSASLSSLAITTPCDLYTTSALDAATLFARGSIGNFDTSAYDLTNQFIIPNQDGKLTSWARVIVKDGSACSATAPPTDTADKHVRFAADAVRGVLNVAWQSGTWPGALKTAAHLGPQGHIGSGSSGWQATQTLVASDCYGLGMSYLANDLLFVCWNQHGKPMFSTSDDFGLSSWTTPSNKTGQGEYTQGGRGQLQAWRIVVGTGIGIAQCRDNRGLLWSDATNMAIGNKLPLAGAAWLRNGYGVLYTRSSDSHVMWAASANLGGGTAVDTGLAGGVYSLVRHPKGWLLGITQTGGGSWIPIWSHDRGATWTAGSAISISPDLGPALCIIGDVVYCCYIQSDAPQFVASVDRGVSWS